ncbi:hypothetical protein ES703_28022 [subsurface metagenome]
MGFSAVDLFVGLAEGAEFALDFFDQSKEQAFLFFSCVSAKPTAQAAPCHNFIFFGNHFARRF